MKKQLFFLFFVIILLCYLLFAPIEAFAAASDGLMLWFHTILPSLLPFIIISNFLISTRKIPVILNHFSQFDFLVESPVSYKAKDNCANKSNK